MASEISRRIFKGMGNQDAVRDARHVIALFDGGSILNDADLTRPEHQLLLVLHDVGLLKPVLERRHIVFRLLGYPDRLTGWVWTDSREWPIQVRRGGKWSV